MEKPKRKYLEQQGRAFVDGEEKANEMGFGVRLFKFMVLDREARDLEPATPFLIRFGNCWKVKPDG